MNSYNIEKGDDLDISGQKLKGYIQYVVPFTSLTNLYIIDEGLATIENLSGCFSSEFGPTSSVQSVKSINLVRFNTVNCKDTSSMFAHLQNLESVSNFNTSNVTNMSDMFAECVNLSEIPNFDTSNVVDFNRFGVWCNNITHVPNFNTINAVNMCQIFDGMNLVEIPNLYTNKVTEIHYAFGNCKMSYLPQFNFSNVVNMGYMCGGCINLVDVPQYDTSSCNYMVGAFRLCNNLSNSSIQNIINMCLLSNISNSNMMNLNPNNSYSPLKNTPFDSSYYSNRLSELTAAGWTY